MADQWLTNLAGSWYNDYNNMDIKIDIIIATYIFRVKETAKTKYLNNYRTFNKANSLV